MGVQSKLKMMVLVPHIDSRLLVHPVPIVPGVSLWEVVEEHQCVQSPVLVVSLEIGYDDYGIGDYGTHDFELRLHHGLKLHVDSWFRV